MNVLRHSMIQLALCPLLAASVFAGLGGEEAPTGIQKVGDSSHSFSLIHPASHAIPQQTQIFMDKLNAFVQTTAEDKIGFHANFLAMDQAFRDMPADQIAQVRQTLDSNKIQLTVAAFVLGSANKPQLRDMQFKIAYLSFYLPAFRGTDSLIDRRLRELEALEMAMYARSALAGTGITLHSVSVETFAYSIPGYLTQERTEEELQRSRDYVRKLSERDLYNLELKKQLK